MMREGQRHLSQPPRRPFKPFPKPYSWFHVVRFHELVLFDGTTTYIWEVFSSFAEKCDPRVETNRPGHAWLMPFCSTNGRCAISTSRSGDNTLQPPTDDDLHQPPPH